MRLLKLSEIAALDAGEVVPGLKCQIKSVGKVYTGENEHGSFTVQKMVVLDETAVITLKLWDKDSYGKEWEGVHIICQSTPGKGGKLTGLIAVDDEYPKGTKTRQVHLKAGSTIAQATDDAPAEPEPPATVFPPFATSAAKPVPAKVAPVKAGPPAPVQAAISQSAPSPVKVAPVPVQGPKKTVQEAGQEIRAAIANAKGKLGQAANGMLLCYDCAIYIANECSKRHPEVTIPLFPPEVIEKLAISLWITLDRSGLVLGLPAGPLDAWTRKPEPAKPVEPPEPEPEQTEAGDSLDVGF